jgi:hypothetical protein
MLCGAVQVARAELTNLRNTDDSGRHAKAKDLVHLSEYDRFDGDAGTKTMANHRRIHLSYSFPIQK